MYSETSIVHQNHFDLLKSLHDICQTPHDTYPTQFDLQKSLLDCEWNKNDLLFGHNGVCLLVLLDIMASGGNLKSIISQTSNKDKSLGDHMRSSEGWATTGGLQRATVGV